MLRLVILSSIIPFVLSSTGDRSQFFQTCTKNCLTTNCTEDGASFVFEGDVDTFNSFFLWTCYDDCKYLCMWRTTAIFIERKWKIPQFFGKWPFKRLFGVQEPASVIFSLLNFIANFKMIRKFRRNVRSDSPLYFLWHFFAGIAMNAWVWSSVFHTRDFPLTELLDYTFAYSIVLSTLYCTLFRIFHKKSWILKTILSLVTVFYFLNHFAYLNVGRFDYSYNIKANVATGMLSSAVWIVWYLVNRKKKPYALKILVFIILTSLSLLLELTDFPPWFWTFDAHSLWHLSTVPLTVLFYSFVIDDCTALRREKFEEEEKKKLI